MPEVPQNMQNDLQRMELEARGVEQKRDPTNPGATPPVGARYSQGHGADDSHS
jgi:hypothetical protein